MEAAQRFAFKVYSEPNDVPTHEIVKTFHTWIQTKRLAEEVVIDVADYGHVVNGPGVVLICHHANYSVDTLDGRQGVSFNRKRDVGGTLEERITSSLRSTLRACKLLEEDLGGKLRFSPREMVFRVNDRLHAPNTGEVATFFDAALRTIASRLYGSAAKLAPVSDDPKQLFGLRIQGEGAASVGALLERL